jgi:hypothetical protein
MTNITHVCRRNMMMIPKHQNIFIINETTAAIKAVGPITM